MSTRSTNNPWRLPDGLNAGSFAFIGGEDAAPVLATVGGSRFPGMLGAVVNHDNASALKASKLSVGTLFMGTYQLVKFTSAITRGHILQWDTLANNGLADYEVTTAVAATSIFRAGIALYTDASATGKFGYIQTGGLASVQFDATVTSAIIGNLVFQDTLTTAVADAEADALAITGVELKSLIGIAYELPVNNTITRVLLNPMGFYPNIGRG
jgi:hypothetical protein